MPNAQAKPNDAANISMILPLDVLLAFVLYAYFFQDDVKDLFLFPFLWIKMLPVFRSAWISWLDL